MHKGEKSGEIERVQDKRRRKANRKEMAKQSKAKQRKAQILAKNCRRKDTQVLEGKIQVLASKATDDFRALFATKMSPAKLAVLMVYMSHLTLTAAYAQAGTYQQAEKMLVEESFGVCFKTAKQCFDAARSVVAAIHEEARQKQQLAPSDTTSGAQCEQDQDKGPEEVPDTDEQQEDEPEELEVLELPQTTVTDQEAPGSQKEVEQPSDMRASSNQEEKGQELEGTAESSQAEQQQQQGQKNSGKESKKAKKGKKKKTSIFDIVVQHANPSLLKQERAEKRKQLEKVRLQWIQNLLSRSNTRLTVREISEEAKKTFRKWGSIGSISNFTRRFYRYACYRIVPYITKVHRRNRLEFVKAVGKETGNHRYQEALKVYWLDSTLNVHIDEKWYRSHRKNVKCLVLKGERAPVLRMNSKSHIPQIMIFAAVCRPVIRNGETKFDGRILVKPLVKVGKYQRRSKRHNPGDPKYQSIPMKRKLFIKYMKEVVDKIMTDKLREAGIKDVILQVDNAGGHSGAKSGSIDRRVFSVLRRYTEKKYKSKYPDVNVWFIAQPPRSPDMNVLDLGAWNSIQCHVPPVLGPDSLDDNQWAHEIIVQTLDAWRGWRSAEKLTNLFETLKVVFHKIEQTRGGNTFDLRSKKGSQEEAEDLEGQVEYDESESEEEIGDDDDDIVYPPGYEPQLAVEEEEPREEEARGEADVQERADRNGEADVELVDKLLVSAEHVDDQHGAKRGREQDIEWDESEHICFDDQTLSGCDSSSQRGTFDRVDSVEASIMEESMDVEAICKPRCSPPRKTPRISQEAIVSLPLDGASAQLGPLIPHP